MRELRSCPLCGRGIAADHGLSDHNYQRHLEACPDQERRRLGVSRRKADRAIKKQQREARQVARRYQRIQEKAAFKARKTGVGSTVVPGPGQRGFPFDDVPEEVTG